MFRSCLVVLGVGSPLTVALALERTHTPSEGACLDGNQTGKELLGKAGKRGDVVYRKKHCCPVCKFSESSEPPRRDESPHWPTCRVLHYFVRPAASSSFVGAPCVNIWLSAWVFVRLNLEKREFFRQKISPVFTASFYFFGTWT